MHNSTVLDQLRSVVASTFDVEVDDLTTASNADDVDGWDSLAHATLVLRLERIFGVSLPHSEAAAAQSLGELAELIARIQNSGSAAVSKSNSVIFGTDGKTLFHRDHDALEQTTGHLQFRSHELDLWVNCIETRHAWCAARGIPYVHMVVPEKHVVYEDLLPEGMKPAPDRPVTRLFTGVTGAARRGMIYPAAILRARRAIRETYLANDTHWTTYGGYLGYLELIRAAQTMLPLTALTEDDVCFIDEPYIGDLGARLTPEISIAAPAVSHRNPTRFRLLYQNKIFDRGNVAVYEGADRTQPRAVLFRDSFANYMIPHLIPLFSRLTVVASPHMLYDLIRHESPDVVFFEMIERFLGYNITPAGDKLLPQDLCGIDTAQFIGISPRELAAV